MSILRKQQQFFAAPLVLCLVGLALLQSTAQVSATHCLGGKPALLGSSTKDGDTVITTWAQAPYKDNYLIGGSSNSADFTEQVSCAQKPGGCAFIANWNSISQRYDQKWIFTQVYSVREIHFQDDASVIDESPFAIVFDRKSESNSLAFLTVVTFNTWKGKSATLATIAHTINEKFETASIDDFAKLSLWYKDTFHTIVNNPNQLQSTDFFFTLDSTKRKLKTVYSDITNTANKANIHLGVPTRKYAQGYGYDKSQIIQLATITVPRGEKELGGVVTLGEPTTYQVIVSRAVTDLGKPFTYLDNQYATIQQGKLDYYYYTQMTMSYYDNAAGVRQGDTVLHTVGMHSRKKNEIQVTSFVISRQLDLVNNQTKIYDLGETASIKVMGVSSRPENNYASKYQVFVTYIDTKQGSSYVGKVLYADLKNDNTVRLFDFTDTIETFGGNSITRDIFGLQQIDDHYLYSGTTNYYPDFADFENYEIDWTSTSRTYGFFMVYTTSDHCDSHIQQGTQEYGPAIFEQFEGNITTLAYPKLVYWIAEKTIKEPPVTLNIGNVDGEKYGQELISQRQIDPDGFPIESQDWKRKGNDAAGLEYEQYMDEIRGDKWLNRFNVTLSSEYQASESAATTSMQIMAAVGMVNSILVFWWFFDYMTTYVNTGFWWTWFTAIVVNGILWMPLFFSWPVLFFAGSTTVNVIAFFAQTTLFGAFGAYWFVVGAMVYVFYIEPTKQKSTYASDADATIWLSVYSSLCLLDSVISIILVPDILDYRDKRNEADELAKQQIEADLEAQEQEDAIFIF